MCDVIGGIEVVASLDVVVSRQGIDWGQTILGQLTHCRLADGTEFFVREGLDSRDSFHVSSGERMGFKRGHIGRGRQALYLAADPAEWDRLAAIVESTDPIGRPVRWSAKFTTAVARRQLAEHAGRAFRQAVNRMPACIVGGFDPCGHKNVADLRFYAETCVDLHNEDQDGAHLTGRELRSVRAFIDSLK